MKTVFIIGIVAALADCASLPHSISLEARDAITYETSRKGDQAAADISDTEIDEIHTKQLLEGVFSQVTTTEENSNVDDIGLTTPINLIEDDIVIESGVTKADSASSAEPFNVKEPSPQKATDFHSDNEEPLSTIVDDKIELKNTDIKLQQIFTKSSTNSEFGITKEDSIKEENSGQEIYSSEKTTVGETLNSNRFTPGLEVSDSDGNRRLTSRGGTARSISGASIAKKSMMSPMQIMPYSFGFSVHDPSEGVYHSRTEEQPDQGPLVGQYSYLRADGIYMTVKYTAGVEGYRATVYETKPPANSQQYINANTNSQQYINANTQYKPTLSANSELDLPTTNVRVSENDKTDFSKKHHVNGAVRLRTPSQILREAYTSSNKFQGQSDHNIQKLATVVPTLKPIGVEQKKRDHLNEYLHNERLLQHQQFQDLIAQQQEELKAFTDSTDYSVSSDVFPSIDEGQYFVASESPNENYNPIVTQPKIDFNTHSSVLTDDQYVIPDNESFKIPNTILQSDNVADAVSTLSSFHDTNQSLGTPNVPDFIHYYDELEVVEDPGIFLNQESFNEKEDINSFISPPVEQGATSALSQAHQGLSSNGQSSTAINSHSNSEIVIVAPPQEAVHSYTQAVRYNPIPVRNLVRTISDVSSIGSPQNIFNYPEEQSSYHDDIKQIKIKNIPEHGKLDSNKFPDNRQTETLFQANAPFNNENIPILASSQTELENNDLRELSSISETFQSENSKIPSATLIINKFKKLDNRFESPQNTASDTIIRPGNVQFIPAQTVQTSESSHKHPYSNELPVDNIIQRVNENLSQHPKLTYDITPNNFVPSYAGSKTDDSESNVETEPNHEFHAINNKEESENFSNTIQEKNTILGNEADSNIIVIEEGAPTNSVLQTFDTKSKLNTNWDQNGKTSIENLNGILDQSIPVIYQTPNEEFKSPVLSKPSYSSDVTENTSNITLPLTAVKLHDIIPYFLNANGITNFKNTQHAVTHHSHNTQQVSFYPIEKISYAHHIENHEKPTNAKITTNSEGTRCICKLKEGGDTTYKLENTIKRIVDKLSESDITYFTRLLNLILETSNPIQKVENKSIGDSLLPIIRDEDNLKPSDIFIDENIFSNAHNNRLQLIKENEYAETTNKNDIPTYILPENELTVPPRIQDSAVYYNKYGNTSPFGNRGSLWEQESLSLNVNSDISPALIAEKYFQFLAKKYSADLPPSVSQVRRLRNDLSLADKYFPNGLTLGIPSTKTIADYAQQSPVNPKPLKEQGRVSHSKDTILLSAVKPLEVIHSLPPAPGISFAHGKYFESFEDKSPNSKLLGPLNSSAALFGIHATDKKITELPGFVNNGAIIRTSYKPYISPTPLPGFTYKLPQHEYVYEDPSK